MHTSILRPFLATVSVWSWIAPARTGMNWPTSQMLTLLMRPQFPSDGSIAT